MNRPAPLLLFLSSLLWLSVSQASSCQQEDGLCVLGIFPHTSLRQLEETYTTIADEISLVLDRDFRLVSARNIDRFLVKLGQHKYDVALAGLGHYLLIGEDAGYIPLARRARNLHYEIIVRPDSSIHSLSDLKGRRYGAMSYTNGSTIATSILLQENGINTEQDLLFQEMGSQQACIHAMVADLVDACAVADPVREVFEKQLNMQFRILGASPPLANVAYIASPKLNDQQRQALQDYFSSREGFVKASKADYSAFRDTIKSYRLSHQNRAR